ncbi:hypothetical protein ACFL0G_01615 [Candidatus Zixiibacteriota bacterium]
MPFEKAPASMLIVENASGGQYYFPNVVLMVPKDRLDSVIGSLIEIVESRRLSRLLTETSFEDCIEYQRFEKDGLANIIEQVQNALWSPVPKRIKHKDWEVWPSSGHLSLSKESGKRVFTPAAVLVMHSKRKLKKEVVPWEEISRELPLELVEKIEKEFIQQVPIPVWKTIPPYARTLEGKVHAGWAMHKQYSRDCEYRFKSGEEEAIFEFCRNAKWALREQWVVRQIESWRREKISEKPNKLMKKYSNATGRTLKTELIRLLKRDKRIYISIAKLKKAHPEKSIERCRNSVSETFFLGTETIKQIHHKFSKIEKLLIRTLYQYRGQLAALHLDMPAPEEINPLLKAVFNLDRIIKNTWDKELKIYQDMRKSYEKVTYCSAKRLRRKKNSKPIRTGEGLKTIFNKTAKRERKSVNSTIRFLGYTTDTLGYVQKLYRDYRFWEAALNREHPEKILEKEGLGEGVRKGLF